MLCWVEQELGEALSGVGWGGGEVGSQGRLDGAEEGEEWWWEGVCWWSDDVVGYWRGFAFDGRFGVFY